MARQLVAADPDSAASMVEDARQTALTALNDIRSVTQTIHPAVLADRGLADAVQALVYDLAVPVDVSGAPPAGLEPAVESAVYFAIAECLANVVKHSAASHVAVTYTTSGDVLRVAIADDGNGGASVAAGTGLRGIVRRLEALDAGLSISSPRGGPTLVTIAVPLDAARR
jgi:signal transduction histidine kinase